ncbi:hypothetical protein ABC345_09945 [Shouchella sp. 1P09AA]|uniref:hypothetical protein n=1 Tax=unclassified Shouchella TaxID=2893065 RepID=UPI00399FE9CC
MSDDTLGIILGIGLVLIVYTVVSVVVKKKSFEVGWKPEWITFFLLLLGIGFLSGVILGGLYGPWGMMAPILLSFGVVPVLIVIVIIKSFFLYVLKKDL